MRPERKQQHQQPEKVSTVIYKPDSKLADRETIEFCNDGFTGTNMERLGMQDTLKQIGQNRIGCILVKDRPRFSKGHIEMGTYLNQIFTFMGVDFIAVNDGYDSRKHDGATITLDAKCAGGE